MSIGKHIKEHIILGAAGWGGSGTLTRTVGNGGDIGTIDDALSWVCGLTGMTQVAASGTVTATESSDVITGSGTSFDTIVRPGDLITMSGDGGYVLVTEGIYFPIYGNVSSATNLRIATGFAGTTGAGKTYEIWRPNKVVLVLLPGDHISSAAHDLPVGINLSVVGVSRLSCVLSSTRTAGQASSIGYSRAGALSFENLTLGRSTSTGIAIVTKGSGVGVLDTCFGEFSLHNVNIADIASGTAGLLSITAATIRINGIAGVTRNGIGNFASDLHAVTNVTIETYDGSAEVIIFTNHALGTYSATKPMMFDSIHADREIANVVGAGAIVEIQGLMANREVHMSNFVIMDRNQQGSANANALALSGAGSGTFHLRNSIIDHAGGGGGAIKNDNAGDVVYLYGVYELDGTVADTTGAATFTTVY